MSSDPLMNTFNNISLKLSETLSEVETYSQIGIIVLVYFTAFILANRVRRYAPILSNEPSCSKSSPLSALAYRFGKLLFPLFAITLLRVSLEFSQYLLKDGWLVDTALSIAVILLFYSFINLTITNPVVAKAFKLIGMPIIFFHVIGILDDIVNFLDAISIQLGTIKLSLYGLVRTVIFGSLLFWLGRVSNTTAQTIIRKQESIDFRTREIFAKLFEITIFFIVVLLLLQLMGINLTALAVFGGAVGVGIGLGLQSIASNFISGIIIIMDRSLSVGDYVTLEDGQSGLVTELNLRSATLETYDGKDIVVPNEKFITGSFTNWTHKNKKQRYRVDFSVAYKTNVRELVELVKEAVATHPQVLSGEKYPIEERPDCEIDSFGDSGINMFVEFWMEGIDDGKNRVGGDLLLTILETLQENNIEIPFPQRDVRIIPQQENTGTIS